MNQKISPREDIKTFKEFMLILEETEKTQSIANLSKIHDYLYKNKRLKDWAILFKRYRDVSEKIIKSYYRC